MNTITQFRSEWKGMLRITLIAALLLAAVHHHTFAQDKRHTTQRGESYGNTLNMGLGIGYYGYIGYSVPFFFANYEFDVAKSFTLAPFVGLGSYRSRNHYFYSGKHYYYHETVVPMGVKATYYFDNILGAGPKWDFYLAGSVGFVYRRLVWDDGYYGSTTLARSASPLYLDGHIGAEYHASKKVGIFLDLSSGVSTLGLAIHL